MAVDCLNVKFCFFALVCVLAGKSRFERSKMQYHKLVIYRFQPPTALVFELQTFSSSRNTRDVWMFYLCHFFLMSAPQNPLFVAFQFFRGCYCFRIPQHQNLHIRADWRLGIYGNPSGGAVSPKSLWCLKSDAISVFWSFTNDCRLLISNNCNDLSVYHLLWCCCLQRRSLKLLILTKNSRIGCEGTLSKNW